VASGSLEDGSHPQARQLDWRRLRLEGKTLSSTDTLENNPQPETAEGLPEHTHQDAHDHEHEGHDHGHDHDHDTRISMGGSQSGLHPRAGSDIPRRSHQGLFERGAQLQEIRKDPRIPRRQGAGDGDQARFATEIRKDVIDGLLPERFNKAVRDLGVAPVGQPQVTELTVEDGQPLHVKAVFEFVPAFSIMVTKA